jgi:PncC family amidohydrolase
VVNDVLNRWAGEIGERLVARRETVSVAESSAGGLISAALVAVPGASRFYRGGVVFYTLGGLRALLGDATDLPLPGRGACEEMARFLAPAAKAKLQADWAIGESGASGPDGNPYGDPPGHAWVSCAGPGGLVRAENVLTGDADRAANMEVFAARALAQLAAALA